MLEFAFKAWWKGRGRFRNHIPRPDCVIGSSPHLLAAASAALLSKRFDTRFILEIRDLWPESLVALGGYSRRHPLILVLRIVERWLYRRADHIVSLVPEAWRYLVTQRVNRERITWISNGACATVSPEIIPSPQGTADRFQAIYIGAHGHANVLNDLLSAAAILQERRVDIQITLIGDGPLKGQLMQRALLEGLSTVEFLDPIPKTDIPAALRRADAAIALMEDTPLYDYGISLNKLFDYFAAGKPVLFAGHVAHDYVAIANAGLTVAPRCPDSIADGLVRLAELSRAERVAMGERGRQYLHTYYDWDLLASKLGDVIRMVASWKKVLDESSD